MASISNVRLLSVGRVSRNVEFVKISVTVSWTNREIKENLWYRLFTYLVEVDGSTDTYTAFPDGGLLRSRGGDDEYVGRIAKEWVRPNGNSSKTFTFRRNWDFGTQEAGNEEYRGIASIVPETRGDVRISSNQISANLG